MQLSPHFSLAELTVTHSGLPNVCPDNYISRLITGAEMLEQVRTMLDEPILIDSGYRAPAVNRAVGGVPNSAHLFAFAADIRTRTYSPLEICKIIAKSPLVFDQLIHEFTWVHIAWGPTPGRRSILTAYEQDGRTSYRTGL